MTPLLLMLQLWTSYDPRGLNKANVPLEGMVRSCYEADLGDHEELVWAQTKRVKGEDIILWEFHAYKDSFGLYLRAQPEDHDRTHKEAGNRILPDNYVTFTDQRRVYTLWELGLRLTIARLNDDDVQCERSYVLITKIKENK